MPILAATFADYVLAIHILAVVIGFGVIFTYPVLFFVGARRDPTVMPWLLRALGAIGRRIINPGLLIVTIAGVYLATDEHQWGTFYVQWGLGAVIVLGALEGAIMIPRGGKLASVAERDLAATQVPSGGRRTSATWSREYQRGFGLLSATALLMALIIIVTVFVMATHA